MSKKLILLIGAVLLTSACSFYNVNTEEITEDFYPPTKAVDVQVLETAPQPHEVIGVVTVNAERNQKMDAIISKMKSEAAKLGGQAVTNIKSDASGAWKKVPLQKLLGNAYIRANFTAQVIVFPATNAVAAPTPKKN